MKNGHFIITYLVPIKELKKINATITKLGLNFIKIAIWGANLVLCSAPKF